MGVKSPLHAPTALSPGKETAGSVSPRDGMDVLEKRTLYCPRTESNGSSSVQIVASSLHELNYFGILII
jgi:hypothetical protein